MGTGAHSSSALCTLRSSVSIRPKETVRDIRYRLSDHLSSLFCVSVFPFSNGARRSGTDGLPHDGDRGTRAAQRKFPRLLCRVFTPTLAGRGKHQHLCRVGILPQRDAGHVCHHAGGPPGRREQSGARPRRLSQPVPCVPKNAHCSLILLQVQCWECQDMYGE